MTSSCGIGPQAGRAQAQPNVTRTELARELLTALLAAIAATAWIALLFLVAG